MMTADEATTLTGHLIMIRDGRNNDHMPARLIRVVNEFTVHVQPGGGHKKIEAVRLDHCFRHDKSVHEAEERVKSQRRNRGIDEPGQADAETPAVHLVIDAGRKLFWSADDKDFVEQLSKATLYESWGRARVARGKIAYSKKHEDLNPIDVEVVSSESARDYAIKWAKVANPEPVIEVKAVEPEVITAEVEQAKPVAAKVGAPKQTGSHDGHHANGANRIPADGWVDSKTLARIARPNAGISGMSIHLWAQAGKIPKVAWKKGDGSRGVYRFDLAHLKACGWIAAEQAKDEEIQKAGRRYVGRPASVRAAAAAAKMIPPPKPESRPIVPTPPPPIAKPPSAALANLLKSITDEGEYAALALEARATELAAEIIATKQRLEIEIEKLKAQAARVRAEAALKVERW